MPMMHIKPIKKFNPPYKPAISEYPIGEDIERPTAFKNDVYPNSNALRNGSSNAHKPMTPYTTAISNKYSLINQINL